MGRFGFSGFTAVRLELFLRWTIA